MQGLQVLHTCTPSCSRRAAQLITRQSKGGVHFTRKYGEHLKAGHWNMHVLNGNNIFNSSSNSSSISSKASSRVIQSLASSTSTKAVGLQKQSQDTKRDHSFSPPSATRTNEMPAFNVHLLNEDLARAHSHASTSNHDHAQHKLSLSKSKLHVQSKEPSELDALCEAYGQILGVVADDASRKGIQKTPMRAAKAMQTLTSGYSMNVEEIVNNALFETDMEDLVVVKDIPFSSLCEHHLLPFHGKIHIGYYPKKVALGLSKFVRLSQVFTRRLQMQEQMTHQIATGLNDVLSPHGVIVASTAEHMCMRMRGVHTPGSSTFTCVALGCFKEHPEMKDAFLRQIQS